MKEEEEKTCEECAGEKREGKGRWGRLEEELVQSVVLIFFSREESSHLGYKVLSTLGSQLMHVVGTVYLMSLDRTGTEVVLDDSARLRTFASLG